MLQPSSWFLLVLSMRKVSAKARKLRNERKSHLLTLFYFSIETLATVGYGDMHPQTDYGHLVATVNTMSQATGPLWPFRLEHTKEREQLRRY
jgi:hypothetical protein